MKLDVLYHDNHLLAVNKPAGLLTQPSGTNQDNLEDRAKAYIKDVKNKPGNVYLHAVHRLDKAVSGAVLFACTDKALSRLNADMRARRFSKIYHAVVCGTLPQTEGSLKHWLTHGEFRAEVSSADNPDAKECLLDYRVLSSSVDRTSSSGGNSPAGNSGPTAGKTTLLEIQLHTGRYHQIRAQLAALGCPIVGDEKYGSKVKLPGGTIALHHARLTVNHPVTKEDIVIKAPYPQHFPKIG